MTTEEKLFPNKTNVKPEELLAMLEYQQACKLDMPGAPGQAVNLFNADNGLHTVIGTNQGDIVLQNRTTFNRQIAQRFKIHANYRDVMLSSAPDLFAYNCNYWLKQKPKRGYTIRAFADYPGATTGWTRAFLSDQYRVVDNLDAITAAMEIVDNLNRKHDYDIQVQHCHISEERLYVTFHARNVQANIRELGAYRDPATGRTGHTGVAMGFVIGNSEIGNGSTFVAPMLQVNACNNSIRWMDKDIIWSRTHKGSRQQFNVVRYSNNTHNLIAKAEIGQIKDCVTHFMSPEFMGKRVDEIRNAMSVELDNPVATITNLSRGFNFSDQKKDALLAAFAAGNSQPNAWDVTQALTFVAQSEDADNRHDSEALAAVLVANPATVAKFDRPLSN